jgi:alkanesulfonate monooxygenase SsuD/methylene tetrahydromethanopterin reductase-like flavin-dependent oxidoreductase (luciferase family)
MIWTPDELLWRSEESLPRGFWEGVSMAGAIAAVTSQARVGTWVMSALHRNAGIIAKTAETLDEISGGRFVFGLGAGHE